MEKFSLFFRNLQQELKLFLFFTILFTLFRIVFISIYSYQLEDGSYREVILCLWYGLRLSLKTTGIIVLISAVFATLPQLLFTKWPSDLLRKVISSLSVVLFTVLFLQECLIIKFLIQDSISCLLMVCMMISVLS